MMTPEQKEQVFAEMGCTRIYTDPEWPRTVGEHSSTGWTFESETDPFGTTVTIIDEPMRVQCSRRHMTPTQFATACRTLAHTLLDLNLEAAQ